MTTTRVRVHVSFTCGACGAELDHDGDGFTCNHCRLNYPTDRNELEPAGEPFECDCSATRWSPEGWFTMGPHEATCAGLPPDCTDRWHDNHGRPE
jgi:hypothetical protein